VGFNLSGSSTTSIYRTQTIISSQTVFQPVSSLPGTTVTVAEEYVLIESFNYYNESGICFPPGEMIENFSAATTYLVPSALPSQFYAKVVTITNMSYSFTTVTITSLTTSTVTVYNIGPNTTQTLYYPELC